MKTYLVMYFGTKGMSCSDIVRRIEKIGFTTLYGPYDFVFDWGGRRPSKEEILAIGDRVVTTLKDTGCVFNLDTHD